MPNMNRNLGSSGFHNDSSRNRTKTLGKPRCWYVKPPVSSAKSMNLASKCGQGGHCRHKLFKFDFGQFRQTQTQWSLSIWANRHCPSTSQTMWWCLWVVHLPWFIIFSDMNFLLWMSLKLPQGKDCCCQAAVIPLRPEPHQEMIASRHVDTNTYTSACRYKCTI